ncbi:MAG: hypothetical protein AAF557_25090 [Pseudomonadota bacterium]
MKRNPCARATRAAIGAVFAVALTAQATTAEEETKPAVSDVNGKIAATGGVLQQEGVYYLDGSVSVPLSHSLGLQLDGLVGVLDGDGVAGTGAHAFWRDPDIGLLGAYGSILASTAGSNYTIGNVGFEGAYYYEDFNFEGAVGVQFGQNIETDAFASLNAAVYLWDDLRLYAGYRYWFEKHSAAGGFEWQLPGNDNSIAWSIFADGRASDENDVTATAGVRVYFGEHKSLKRRHREDDPISLLPTDLSIIVNQLATARMSLPPGCAVGDGEGGCRECLDGYFLVRGLYDRMTLRDGISGGMCVPETTLTARPQG